MLKPALWSPLEPAWDSEVTPLLDPKVILGVATGQRQVPPGDHLMTSQRSRCPGNEIVCRTGASSNRFCPVSFRRVLLAPTSCRAQNAPCFSFLERLLFWFSADRRGEAPAGCRRVYSHRFTHEFPRRAQNSDSRRCIVRARSRKSLKISIAPRSSRLIYWSYPDFGCS